MFLRWLAGHHPQHQQGGGAAGDQYRPSDPLLLGHAHHRDSAADSACSAEHAGPFQRPGRGGAAADLPARLGGAAQDPRSGEYHLGDYGPA